MIKLDNLNIQLDIELANNLKIKLWSELQTSNQLKGCLSNQINANYSAQLRDLRRQFRDILERSLKND